MAAELIRTSSFIGHFPVTVDVKNRIKLPVRFLDVLREAYGDQASSLHTCISMDRNIDIFPVGEWYAHMEQLQAGSVYDVAKRKVYTVIQGSTNSVELDKQGRLKLSPSLMKHTGITKSAYLCGFSTRMELWDAVRWEEFCQQTLDSFPETQERLYQEQKQLQLGQLPQPGIVDGRTDL